MTVTEIAEICDVSRDKVLRTMHEHLPDKITEKNKKIVFNQDETDLLLSILEPHHRKVMKSNTKQSKVLHLSIKRNIDSATLKQLAKYLSPEEIREYILKSTQITSFKQLESDEKEKEQ